MEDFKVWVEKAQENALKLCSNEINICAHVWFDQEDELYLAHCLEFDIVAEGYTEKEAEKNILKAIVNHIVFCVANGNVEKIMNPAPREYWCKFYFNSKPLREPFRFTENYTYGNLKLPFLHNFISTVEFNKSVSHAKA